MGWGLVSHQALDAEAVGVARGHVAWHPLLLLLRGRLGSDGGSLSRIRLAKRG